MRPACVRCGHELGSHTPFGVCEACHCEGLERDIARGMLATVDDAAHDFRLREPGYRRTDALERQARIESALA